MKRVTKIALAIAGIFMVIGVVCVVAAFSMGIKYETLTGLLNHGNFQIGKHTIHLFDDDSHHTDEMGTGCKNLEIELSAGNLEIYYSDVDEIQVEESSVSGFESYIEDDTLHIEGGGKFGIHKGEAKIIVQIPDEMKFQKVELELGAGKSTIEGLSAEQIHVELGAGEAVLKNITADRMEAEVGTGKLQMELSGVEKDYSYDIECGIGEIQIGDSSFGGFGETHKNLNGELGKVIELECGIGEIQITFTEE